MLTKVCLVLDNSASMSSFHSDALKDLNATLENLRSEATDTNIILLSIVQFTVSSRYTVKDETRRAVVKIANVPIKDVKDYEYYDCPINHTPLYDSVAEAIDVLKDSGTTTGDIAYLVMVITDGDENSSVTSAKTLEVKMKELVKTDKWTFVFRVPQGYKRKLVERLGVSSNNVLEWELTSEALRNSTVATTSATRSYFRSRSLGVTASNSFYTNLNDTPINEIKTNLTDITNQIKVEPVWDNDRDSSIRDFCKSHFGEYKAGNAFYQLDKPETIQSYKKIVIKHAKTGCYYGGDDARNLLKLPAYEIKVKPGDHGDYEIFVQSTSYNRKLKPNTKVIYWQ